MVQRVLIQGGANAAAMQVSLPGVDVTTANIDQMCLDSRWSGHQFYKSGFVSSSNDVNNVFFFGETLSEVPFLVGWVDPAITINPGVQALGLQNFRGNSSDFWYYAVVSTSAVQFRANFGNQVGRLYFALFRRVAG